MNWYHIVVQIGSSLMTMGLYILFETMSVQILLLLTNWAIIVFYYCVYNYVYYCVLNSVVYFKYKS